ncbi:LOW QUALITY PROTEIN: kinesin-like protein Klp59C [Drosophila tropicalis]|uniref:LOW QUALITY PROTEIN: kinesin-like protein Klp59C n=1 Tax=Drosophila tropicalis TaxID=46794 RepID=UPI0035AC263C
MDVLSINQEVYIKRSDGRVHLARIIKLDGGSNNVVTVEWFEGGATQGKGLSIESIVKLNPQIYEAPLCSTASISPRATPKCPLALARLKAGGSSFAPRRLAPRVVTAMPRQLPREDVVVAQIDHLRQRREKRRQQQALARDMREKQKNEDPGNPHWELARMIRLHRLQMDFHPLRLGIRGQLKQHQIVVCVRKRPLNHKEQRERELDVITVPTKDSLVVHEPRKHVNLVKFLENHNFRFDYTFNEECSNAMVYEYTARPLVRHVFEGGMATCFAYGQTGSGKTHTMGGQFTGKQQNPRDGIYAMAAVDVFDNLRQTKYVRLGLTVTCCFFEIYGSRVYDLLMPGKPQLRVLEDGHQVVQVVGLTEKAVKDTSDVLTLLELGNTVRTSGHTSANAKSSRSHAVFQIVLRYSKNNRLHGKFSLIDLAGNERGADNSSADRLTRLEAAEINKSLLALKECIRALGRQSAHVPFRGSKLTQVLRDSFIGGVKVKTCMIAMISPGLNSVEHTLNTLRYADRVKELTAQPPSPKRPTKDRVVSVYYDDENNGIWSHRNSLPDLTASQTALRPQPSATSLPEDGDASASNGIYSEWNSHKYHRNQEDDNLAYFNAVTDNYHLTEETKKQEGAAAKNKPK